jgi:hypothetical protein
MPGAAILGLCEMLAHAFPGDDTGRPVLDARAIYLAVNGRKPGRGSAGAASQASLALALARGCLRGSLAERGSGFPRVIRICQWLERPAAEFTCFVPDLE